MSRNSLYDVVVVGGGPVGWAAAYEIAKAGNSVIVLEQNTFFNQAGSSGDLARMFRTMYTEDFMATMAYDSMKMWDALEKDAGVSLRSMSGLLNFGDKTYGKGGPEGTLMDPIKNLNRLKMPYKRLTSAQIQERYPFKDLPEEWEGLFAPDNGVINVQLLIRTLSRLAKDYGAHAHQYVEVDKVQPNPQRERGWRASGFKHGTEPVEYHGRKIILTCGAYVNHVLEPSFGFKFDLEIWEMVANYFSVNPGPNGTIFPSMWFQFAKDVDKRSRLFYGFPALEWGPPNVARIAVDGATRKIHDPSERTANVVNPEDIKDTQDFIREHVTGVDWTVPAFTMTCLQTNVYDNMFVLDFVPEKYLKDGEKDSVIVFTAGWAMKFIPLLGKALKDMALGGTSKYALEEFSMIRKDEETRRSVILEQNHDLKSFESTALNHVQGKGSSMRAVSSKT